ncbi:WYL domain-containing protein [Agrococcus sp. SCSIO52902]|uniref:helix-turn-helix transcriptional regulator n=1 Tax=Agrococcus sp. SCSIO52902 TaxID=2933290 RepID=UPI001FF6EFA3|nr:WYL domain-containing protein [Agrococcus sp. SCSIO52902]UOW00421.1 WYL domain-containing protein [Agrococcus sp. SCSIO52902]
MQRIEAEERQFSLLLALVDTRTGFTKQELFSRVAGYQGQSAGQALERMFERDKDALREHGIVIDVVQPPGDDSNHEARYRVLDGVLGDPAELQFDAEERELLDLALRIWHEGGLTEEAQRAALKLRADPEFRGGLPLERTPGRTDEPEASAASVLQPRQRPRESAFQALKRAADRGREVVFDYLKPGDRSPRTRTVQPWATVLFRGRWMLVGHDLGAEDARTFLMQRIVSPVHDRAAKQPFEAPADAAAAALEKLEEIWQGATVAVRAVPGSDADIRLRHRPGTAEEDGLLLIHHADRHLIADELAGFGADVAVVRPDELRDLVRERLERIRDAHAPASAHAHASGAQA